MDIKERVEATAELPVGALPQSYLEKLATIRKAHKSMKYGEGDGGIKVK